MPVDGAVGRELLPELARVPGHLLWRASARVSAVVQEHLADDPDVHAYAALLALGSGAPRSQQHLADAVAVSRTTMAKVAAGLVRDGLAERVRNPNDRRSYLLTRTAAGARAERGWRARVAELEPVLVPGAAERRRLRELLRRVVVPRLAGSVAPELLDALGFLVTKAHALAHREVQVALQPWGVEPRHLGSTIALTALGPVPQATLARVIGVTPATTVQIVDDMERLDLVRRERDESDRRTQVLHLTAHSSEVLPQVRRAAGAALDRVLAPLDDAERSELVTLLRDLVTAA